MLVKVLNFGTNWWARFGSDPDDPDRYSRHAAYYNSTGVQCGLKIRRHWIVPGLVRFNGVDGFHSGLADNAIGITFVCSDLTHALGGNRLLFKSRAARSAVPDRYLVVVSSGIYGRIDFASKVWKSALSWLIAVSQLRMAQEAMLLMNPGDWIQTCNGFWQLNVPENSRESERLQRIGERIPA
jgi:hypothetical protein